MTTLTLDRGMAKPLAECEDGETETFSVTGVFHRNPDGSVSIDVSAVAPSEGDTEEAGEQDMEGKDAPPKPGKRGGGIPAIAILVGKKGGPRA